MTAAPVVVALVRDLMDRSRFAALSEAGTQVTFVRSVTDLARVLGGGGDGVGAGGGIGTGPEVVVVVDLATPDALEGVAAAVAAPTSGRVVAFGAHVDRSRLDDAHAAGAEVMARSAFFDRLGDLAR